MPLCRSSTLAKLASEDTRLSCSKRLVLWPLLPEDRSLLLRRRLSDRRFAVIATMRGRGFTGAVWNTLPWWFGGSATPTAQDYESA